MKHGRNCKTNFILNLFLLGLGFRTHCTLSTSTFYFDFFYIFPSSFSVLSFFVLLQNLKCGLFLCLEVTQILTFSPHFPVGFLFTWLSSSMQMSYNNISLWHGPCSCKLHLLPNPATHSHISVSPGNFLTMYIPLLVGQGELSCTSVHHPQCGTSPGTVNLFSSCSLSSLFPLLWCVFPRGHPAVWPCHMGFLTAKTKHGLPLSGCTRFTLLSVRYFPCIPAWLH